MFWDNYHRTCNNDDKERRQIDGNSPNPSYIYLPISFYRKYLLLCSKAFSKTKKTDSNCLKIQTEHIIMSRS